MSHNFEILEQLSYIFHTEQGIAKVQAGHCIRMMSEIILLHDGNFTDNTPDEEKGYTADLNIAPNYSMSILDKYSAFGQEKYQENQYLASNMVKYMKAYKGCKEDLEVQASANFDISQWQIVGKLKKECADKYLNAYGAGDVTPIDIMYSGRDFYVKNIDDDWIRNGDIDLTSGYRYQFNISAPSGHPLVIRTEPVKNVGSVGIELFNSGEAIPDGFTFSLPYSGVDEIDGGYGPLFYDCKHNDEPAHFSGSYDLDLSIIGTNDKPILNIVDNYKIAIEEVDASNQSIFVQGELQLLDLDVTDTLNFVVTPKSLFGSLSQASNVEISGVVSDGQVKKLKWTYTSPSGNLDFISKDQYISIDYDIKIFDGYEYSNIQPIRINIIGTNDSPEINDDTGIFTGSVTRIPAGDPDENSTLFAQGVFSFTDPDLLDTHTLTYEAESVLGQTYYGDFNIATQNKQVTWVFEVDNVDLQDLSPGASIEQIYAVTIKDNHNSLDTALITVGIYGEDAVVQSNIKILNAPNSGVMIETNEGLVSSGVIDIDVDLLDEKDFPISFDVDINVTGFTSGLNVSDQSLIRMLKVDFDEDEKKIDWTFNSEGVAFDYIPEGQILKLEYKIYLEGDQEGGILNINPPFKVAVIPIRPEVILPTGTHNYISGEYWPNDINVPVKYGGIGEIKAISSNNSYCWDLANFKYRSEGWCGQNIPPLVFPFYPPGKSNVEQFDQYNWNKGEYSKTLYSSSIFKPANNDKQFKLKIGRSSNDFGPGSGMYGFYDSPGDIDPFVRSTKFPAEKVSISVNKNFTIEDNDAYPTGDNGEALEFGLINDRNQKLLFDSDSIEYRNISLVDVRTNVYPVRTITAYTRQFVLSPPVGYRYEPHVSYFQEVTETNDYLGLGENPIDLINNGTPVYQLFQMNVIVQNRQWHRDAGHAFVEHLLEITDLERGDIDIVDVNNIGSYNKIFGYVPWYNGGNLNVGNRIVKVGGISGIQGASFCPCGEDQNDDGIPDPIDCGCTEVTGPQFMTFPPSPGYAPTLYDIDDLEVGMYVWGPGVRFGTKIDQIIRTNTVGNCGAKIRLSEAASDENPINGNNAGFCTSYGYYNFTSFPNQAYKTYELEYPLRSNRGVVFEYGVTDGLSFIQIFWSFEFYNEWKEIILYPFTGYIDRLENPFLVYRTQIFTNDTGWTLSSWNKCRRQVSRSVIEPKLGSTFSQADGLYPYSPMYCNGLLPSYDIGFMDCPAPLCSDRQEVDPCCIQGSQVSYGNPDYCIPQDIVDYEGQPYFQNFTLVLYAGWYYILNNTGGTGHAGNSEFPSGVVPDPFRRPLIDQYEPSERDELRNGLCVYSPNSFVNSWLGYIDPTSEISNNYNTNRAPGGLTSSAGVQGVVPFQCAVSNDPFYVYQEHGYEQFIVTCRAKRAVMKYLPIYYPNYDAAFDEIFGWSGIPGNIIIDTFFPDMSPIDDEGYCIYSDNVIDYSAGNLKTTTKLNNLHINITRGIEHTYPNNPVLLSGDLTNNIVFSGEVLLPKDNYTILTNKNFLQAPISQGFLDHYNDYRTSFEYLNMQYHIRRGDNFVGDNINVGNRYCYLTPQDISICGSGNGTTVSKKPIEAIRSLQHLDYELFGTPDYLYSMMPNCCLLPGNYEKNACECFLSNWDSDRGANFHWNRLGLNTPRIDHDLPYIDHPINAANRKLNPHLSHKRYKLALEQVFGYSSQAAFNFEATHPDGCVAWAYEVFGVASYTPDPDIDDTSGWPVDYIHDCCGIPVSSGKCPVIKHALFHDVHFIYEDMVSVIPETTVPYSFPYENPGSKCHPESSGIRWIHGVLEWYPDDTYGSNTEGNDLWTRVIFYYEEYISNIRTVLETGAAPWQKLECNQKDLGYSATVNVGPVTATVNIQGDCFAAFLMEFSNGCYYGPTDLIEA